MKRERERERREINDTRVAIAKFFLFDWEVKTVGESAGGVLIGKKKKTPSQEEYE